MIDRFPVEFIEDYNLLGTFRGLQEAIANRYSLQMMRCPVHLSIGQEYWLPIIRRLVHDGDRCFSSHRSHSMYMALGGNFERLIAELHGHESGCVSGLGGSMHLKDISVGLEQSVPIVGSSIGLALGSALAAQRNKQNILTLAYFGDGACEEGIVHEALNISYILNLPILFICENNAYSCNTHVRRRQSSSKMSRFAEAHGIENNTIAQSMSYSLLDKEIADAFRIARNKPFFLEVMSFRLYEHCGSLVDKDKGDRIESEYNAHLQEDYYRILRKRYPSVQDCYQDAFAYYTTMIDEYSSKNRELILQ